MTDRTITCEQAVRLLAAYLDGELDGLGHGDVERHLNACRSCYSRWEFEREIKTRLAAVGQQPPDPRFAQRIRNLVRQFTKGDPGSPAV